MSRERRDTKFRLANIMLIIAVALAFSAFITLTRRTVVASGNQPPVASFIYLPENPMPQEIITFDASSSYDADGQIVQYSWNFGDGNITSLSTPTIVHVYPVDGNYTVELTVIDNSGLASSAIAVVQVNCEVFFRVCVYGTLTPIAGVKVTVYYYNGVAWVPAPASSNGVEIRYDNMTQPDLADTPQEKYRNPGYTASILRCGASNIGFDFHQSGWRVFFKFEWGPYVAYWPNETTKVRNYYNGAIETHSYSSSNRAQWDSTAGTYVIKVSNIAKDGVNPTASHPIIVGILCPSPPQKYYLAVRTNPSGITTIPGEGWYNKDQLVTLTAPQYVDVSGNTRYSFSYWDVDGSSQGSGVNPITVCMNTNHTATAHYILQYLVSFTHSGLSSDAIGTVVTVDGSGKAYSDLPFSKWVNSGGSVTYSYSSLVSSSVSGKRYSLNSVSGPSSPITVTGPVSVTGIYCAQYSVTFTHSGLDSTATGTVVTVNGDGKTYSQLPYTIWVNSGSSVTYSYTSPVSSSVSGKRFRLDSVTGPSSPITVTSSVTVTGVYCAQYSVTFTHSGLDSTAVGTVVTVNANAKTYADLPYIVWVDSGSSVTYSYSSIVLSTTSGKRFQLTSVTGPSSPITVTSAVTVTGNYVVQYLVTFDQTGVGTDFTGIVVTIDSVNYNVGGLPVQFWWNKDSAHSFSFASPLTVNASKQYLWSSTSGLSTLQSGTLIATTSGSVTGNYVVANSITFDQSGVSSDFTGTVVVIDGTPYGASSLPVSFMWQVGSSHSFAFQSPLVVSANGKRYLWTSTSGLSTLQSGTIIVTAFGSIIGNYKTQYYLTLATNPSGVASPSGSGWYDANTFASISTSALVDIVPGSSRYKFSDWSTADMAEITDPYSSSTTVLMDKAKTVTANYVIQYYVTFSQSGVGSDFTGTVVTIDSTPYTISTLPVSFWWNKDSIHSFAFSSPLIVNVSRYYDWISTTGLSTLQSGTLTVTTYGSVTGNYAVHLKYQVTFDVTGLGGDAMGTIVTIDSVDYSFIDLPVSFWWDAGSNHTFSFVPIIDVGGGIRYVWNSTSGLSTLRSGTITVSVSGSIIAHYKTQYYLTLATNPSGVASPSGFGWYDANAYATISTQAFVDIVPGSSRYRFNGWTTPDMPEITDPTKSPTTVLMDKPKTVTAHYATQYYITFSQSGVGSDFAGTVVTVDSVSYTVGTLPVSFWWDKDSVHTFAYASPLVVTPNAKQYVWTSTTGLSTLQSGSITVSSAGTVTGNYKTQYYLTVSSPYGSPNPTSGWFDSASSITASVNSPVSGPTDTRYVCIGWSGTGSAPPSGTGTSVAFTITQPSSITWNWKTQYKLYVFTNPQGLTPEPTRNPPGEPGGSWWYDASTDVVLTAQPVSGFTFTRWDVDGVYRDIGVNPITLGMGTPHVATAHYAPPPLSVGITPVSASVRVGQSVLFMALPNGGAPPYHYEWYLNGSLVSGATSDKWNFIPTSTGVYFVYVKVTDSMSNTAQSETASVTVTIAGPGGYSILLTRTVPTLQLASYIMLVFMFCAVLTVFRHKRK